MPEPRVGALGARTFETCLGSEVALFSHRDDAPMSASVVDVSWLQGIASANRGDWQIATPDPAVQRTNHPLEKHICYREEGELGVLPCPSLSPSFDRRGQELRRGLERPRADRLDAVVPLLEQGPAGMLVGAAVSRKEDR